jgi:hypothetical protein
MTFTKVLVTGAHVAGQSLGAESPALDAPAVPMAVAVRTKLLSPTTQLL